MTKVAVCQILSTNDPAHNLAVSSKVIRDAVAAGAKAVFLPEASDFIATSAQECRDLSFPLSQHPYALGLQKLAKELGVTVSAGVHDLPEADEPNHEPEGSIRVYNTHVLIGADGSLLARYRKLHLFDVELAQTNEDGTPAKPKRTGESDRIIPGGEIVPPIPIAGVGNIGLEICYDLRFPELHIILTRLGADILTFPSAFTLRTGKDHWPTLCRAVAIQYQVYVLAAAQYGDHNPSRSSWGESLAFDPWGRELGRLRSIKEESPDVDRMYAEGGEFFICDVDTGVVGIDQYGIVGKELPEPPLKE
ncbi:Carbon-nitrogen hydrolase [Apiotrichum porosum]|uniref:Carbon-nitrogen hydrolase n=1 Tax=Apiotrichum porosum TaxID=105984 RepID=A0A427XHP6_9TREE|nr:Carbon-nitrogen hydrolase [Apiotrichum porosum]RSH78283.1 Carbon-nitrogen hydrolase [Apiotrichum porosum]